MCVLRDKYFAYDYVMYVCTSTLFVNREYIPHDLEPMGMDALDVLQNNNMYEKLYNMNTLWKDQVSMI